MVATAATSEEPTAGASDSFATPAGPARLHTVWGLSPAQLHDRLWASRGVQVVRCGEKTELVNHAELFLLADPRTLAMFSLAPILDTFSWLAPAVCTIRLIDSRERGYKENVSCGPERRFTRLRRVYAGGEPQFARVAITRDRDIAAMWQSITDRRHAWRQLWQALPRSDRQVASVRARVFDASQDAESAQFVRDLVQRWKRPDVTINGLSEVRPGVWAHESATVDPTAVFTGSMWIGAGRSVGPGVSAVGPGAMWDSAQSTPAAGDVQWLDLEPISAMHRPVVRQSTRVQAAAKRAFDIVFSVLALLVTLPLYPIIMLAILIEDGTPFFFSHERETIGGRRFGCMKFRSMRKDAEKIKTQLAEANQADGPQFYMDNDPRLTRVGHYIRKYQLDELPQFINVLAGDMSIVGPRPSPFKENQYCPGWREARLSVRPGVTGLWQVRRTRAQGTDFQEWIKYDIEYVERHTFWLDLLIIWQTVAMLFGRFTKP